MPRKPGHLHKACERRDNSFSAGGGPFYRPASLVFPAIIVSVTHPNANCTGAIAICTRAIAICTAAIGNVTREIANVTLAISNVRRAIGNRMNAISNVRRAIGNRVVAIGICRRAIDNCTPAIKICASDIANCVRDIEPSKGDARKFNLAGNPFNPHEKEVSTHVNQPDTTNSTGSPASRP